ncbi:MAG: hypothetical protein V4662_23045 [Verrucomicrobiota bacterium]
MDNTWIIYVVIGGWLLLEVVLPVWLASRAHKREPLVLTACQRTFWRRMLVFAVIVVAALAALELINRGMAGT